MLRWFRQYRKPLALSLLLVTFVEYWRFVVIFADDVDLAALENPAAAARSAARRSAKDEDDKQQQKLQQQNAGKDEQLRKVADISGGTILHATGAEIEPKNKVSQKNRGANLTTARPTTTTTAAKGRNEASKVRVDGNVSQSARNNSDGNDTTIFVDTSAPILNPHPYKYLINCPNLCGDQDIFMLNYVHTAVGHYSRRARIRRTWGRESNYPGVRMKTVFFLGLSNKTPWMQQAIEYEARKYGDIVQEDFLDTYRNLSYKGVAALKWITTYCNQTTYVLKTDDDVFVNMFAIQKHLKDLYANNYRSRMIVCLVWWRMHVLREGQWGIPKEDIPDDLYPVYCSGMGFLLSTDAAIAMYKVSFHIKFRWVDDAFISGYLPQALNGQVKHYDMVRGYCGAEEMGVYNHDTEWCKYAFTHVHNEDLYQKTWDKLVNIAKQKSIPTPSIVKPGNLADNYIPKAVLFPELEARRKQRQLEEKKKQEAAKKAEEAKAKQKELEEKKKQEAAKKLEEAKTKQRQLEEQKKQAEAAKKAEEAKAKQRQLDETKKQEAAKKTEQAKAKQ